MNLFWLTAKLRQNYPVLREPAEPHPQRAAVLAILYPRHGRTHALMIKRADHLKVHPGEISFPGGVFREEDGDLLTTALRETAEELALEVPADSVVGKLSAVMTRTGFEITPFVAMLDGPVRYEANEEEVELALEIPLTPLLATQQPDVGYKPSEEMFVFWFQQYRIWGASARILHEISVLCAH